MSRSSSRASSLRADQARGIFSAEWYKWRGATLRVELPDEPPFAARLEAVESPSGVVQGVKQRTALLTVLSAQGQAVEVRTLPWPPPGSIRVIRAP